MQETALKEVEGTLLKMKRTYRHTYRRGSFIQRDGTPLVYVGIWYSSRELAAFSAIAADILRLSSNFLGDSLKNITIGGLRSYTLIMPLPTEYFIALITRPHTYPSPPMNAIRSTISELIVMLEPVTELLKTMKFDVKEKEPPDLTKFRGEIQYTKDLQTKVRDAPEVRREIQELMKSFVESVPGAQQGAFILNGGRDQNSIVHKSNSIMEDVNPLGLSLLDEARLMQYCLDDINWYNRLPGSTVTEVLCEYSKYFFHIYRLDEGILSILISKKEWKPRRFISKGLPLLSKHVGEINQFFRRL